MAERIPGWDEMQYASLRACGVTCDCRPGRIVALCEQGKDEWFRLRKGRVTASKVGAVVGIKGERSQSATCDSFKWALVAERLTGTLPDTHVTAAMQYGTDTEPQAREWYVARYQPVREVGFIWHDATTHDMGASPDGLCADRGLEIKCPTAAVACKTLYRISTKKRPADGIDAAHRLQMQFAMWCSGIPRWDYLLYSDPIRNIPCLVVTVEADAKLHDAFDRILPEFNAEVAEAVESIRGEDAI